MTQHLCLADPEPQAGASSGPGLASVPTLTANSQEEESKGPPRACRGGGPAFCQTHAVSDPSKREEDLRPGHQCNTQQLQVAAHPFVPVTLMGFLTMLSPSRRKATTSNISPHHMALTCRTKRRARTPRKTPKVSYGSAPNASQDPLQPREVFVEGESGTWWLQATWGFVNAGKDILIDPGRGASWGAKHIRDMGRRAQRNKV